MLQGSLTLTASPRLFVFFATLMCSWRYFEKSAGLKTLSFAASQVG